MKNAISTLLVTASLLPVLPEVTAAEVAFDYPPALSLEEVGDPVLHAHGTEHPRLPHLDERRALGEGLKTRHNAYRAQLVFGATIQSQQSNYLTILALTEQVYHQFQALAMKRPLPL